MKPRYLFIRATALALVFLSSLPVIAQTCRVNCGVSANGVRKYMEVFEYDFVSEKPVFPGGDEMLMAFINEHRQYPAKAYRQGIQGRVMCAFVVNTDGSISNVSILKGVEKSLNAEALRVLGKMPKWKPGRHDGIAVPVRVVRTIAFRK